ncbi:MAG: hypothetical protein ABFD80_10505 [Acidobacteriota bacterium]
MDIQDEVRRRLKTFTLIGITFVSSLLVYLGLAEFIRYHFRPFGGFAAIADPQRLRYVFFALAVLSVVLVRVLRPALLRKSPGEDAKTTLHRLERASLVTLVLAEVPALLGLILFFLRGFNVDFYILLFASLLLVFMYFPRRSNWQEWLS